MSSNAPSIVVCCLESQPQRKRRLCETHKPAADFAGHAPQFLATGLQRDRNSPLERMRVWQFPDPQLPPGRVWVNVLELICFAVIQKQQTMAIRRLSNDVPDWLAAMSDRDGTAAAVRQHGVMIDAQLLVNRCHNVSR